MDDPTFRLADTPVHLGLGASASVLEPFDGTPAWYERYGAAHGGDGVEDRLVALHTVTIGPGDAVINPPGVWHTADVDDRATVLFVTAGLGTENRAR